MILERFQRQPLAFVLSLCLHTLLVIPYCIGMLRLAAPISDSSPMILEMLDTSGGHHSSAATVEKPTPKPQSHQAKAADGVATKNSVTQTAQASSAPSSTNTGGPTSAQGIKNAEDFRLALRSAIEREKEYPAIARARRQEGQVLIGFTLTKDGRVISVHMVKPSSYERLNQAALATLQRVGSFRRIPDEISRGDWDVTVPIEFKIE